MKKMRDDVISYLCKQMLKGNDNQSDKNRCHANVGDAFQSLSEDDRLLLDSLVGNAKGLDEAIDSLEDQINKSKTLTQCKLVDEDEITERVMVMKIRKDDLDETILDLIIDGIGND